MTRRVNLASPIPGDIESALDELGISYVVRDNEAKALCPNPEHRDRKPSWSCNLITGKHNCFSCGFGGSFVRLVGVVNDLPRADATLWVRKRGGVERGRVMVGHTQREVREVRKYSEADLALFGWPPEDMLESRGITQVAAQEYNLLWDDRRELWILPVRDPYSRRLRGWQEKGPDYFKNVPWGLEKADCLFGLDKIRKSQRRIILVESPLDAPRIFCAGVMGTVASFGAEVSERQLEVLEDHCDELLCALDDDNAGWKRAAWIKEHWRKRLKYFDYDAAWAGRKGKRKDPGEMEDDEIRRGVDRAYSSLLARF